MIGNGEYDLVPIDRKSITQQNAQQSTTCDLQSAETRTKNMRSKLSGLKSQHVKPAKKSVSSILKFVAVLKVMLPGSGAQLARLLFTIGVQTGCAEVASRLAGAMLSAMLARNKNVFWYNAVASFCLAIVSAFVEEYVSHQQNCVSLTWSCKLSETLRKLFFKNNTFYNMKYIDKTIVDADQRMTEELVELSVSLV